MSKKNPDTSSFYPVGLGQNPYFTIYLICFCRCDLCGVKFTSVVASEDHYRGAKHEKKVKLKLVELFPEESSRPKKLKVECLTGLNRIGTNTAQRIHSNLQSKCCESVTSLNKVLSYKKVYTSPTSTYEVSLESYTQGLFI